MRRRRANCGEDDERRLVLHHKTYIRLGAEDLRDLHPLCLTCHNDVHLIAKRGLAPFDLEDYASEKRRRTYAHEREAALDRRDEPPDRHPDAPFDDFNWRIQAQVRHAGAQDRRQAARRLARNIRAMG